MAWAALADTLQGHFNRCLAHRRVSVYVRIQEMCSSSPAGSHWSFCLYCNCPIQMWLKSAQTPNTKTSLANQVQDEQWLTFLHVWGLGWCRWHLNWALQTEFDYSQKQLSRQQKHEHSKIWEETQVWEAVSHNWGRMTKLTVLSSFTANQDALV